MPTWAADSYLSREVVICSRSSCTEYWIFRLKCWHRAGGKQEVGSGSPIRAGKTRGSTTFPEPPPLPRQSKSLPLCPAHPQELNPAASPCPQARILIPPVPSPQQHYRKSWHVCGSLNTPRYCSRPHPVTLSGVPSITSLPNINPFPGQILLNFQSIARASPPLGSPLWFPQNRFAISLGSYSPLSETFTALIDANECQRVGSWTGKRGREGRKRKKWSF